MTKQVITLSDRAASRVKEIMAAAGKSIVGVRIGVRVGVRGEEVRGGERR